MKLNRVRVGVDKIVDYISSFIGKDLGLSYTNLILNEVHLLEVEDLTLS